MDTFQALGSVLGFGLFAGIRLYATVFALGLAIRMGWFQLERGMAGLTILADPAVLVAAGALCLVEFLADKVPWLDSIWDSVHVIIRPVGAALLAATAFGSFNPVTRVIVALLTGSVAFTSHSTKAATRLAVNHSPEPFSNIGLSVAEDTLVPVGLWTIIQYPSVALPLVCGFLILFAWLSPKIFRLVNILWTALRSILLRWFGVPSVTPPDLPRHPILTPELRHDLSALSFEPLADAYLRRLHGRNPGTRVKVGIHCASRTGVLKNSTGYLCILSDRFVFLTRRTFRIRCQEITFQDLTNVQLRAGVFLDGLVLSTAHHSWTFYLFKGAAAARRHRLTLASQAR